ncbi:accessory factor UbiK family protein [Reinekea sp.]|uniref:accessory factor UbiK family protein n=1 Tax=Reinekea sp. TaxID=1970455 RepID=UPI002A7FAD30|nr:accessory factor UbiK family protein [Reinekea sp.]
MKTPEAVLDLISDQISDLLSHGKQTGQEIRHNVRSLVQSQLAKLDVVSREEFETQQLILAKTRRKIEALEVQLGELETALNNSTPKSDGAR